ncbi:hypothetical protein [uncultured Aquimarina sp.]|uniref:hypothetical protein n=1 Tax=uncultured Aquimarina sp. TaxID=575652 RepID=UPI002626EB4E|nr:hypothetical protein [uncultured Aquimarina sp.]
MNQEDLPNSKSSKNQERLVTVSQGRNSSLNLYPSKEDINIRYIPYNIKNINLNYGVRIIQEQNDLQNQQLDFEVNVSVIEDEDIYAFKISRSQVYVNNNSPNTTIDEIANLCGGVLFPVLIDFYDYTIKNIPEIKGRWFELKKTLKKRFQGDYITNYIYSMEQTLKNDLAINQALRQDMFLSIWKHTLETRAYDEMLRSKVIFNFPIMPYTNSIRYEGNQDVKKHYTTYNTIKTILKGKIAENRSVNDLKNKKRFSTEATVEGSKPEGDCDVEYDLDRKTGVLKFFKSKTTIKLEKDSRFTTLIINELIN